MSSMISCNTRSDQLPVLGPRWIQEELAPAIGTATLRPARSWTCANLRALSSAFRPIWRLRVESWPDSPPGPSALPGPSGRAMPVTDLGQERCEAILVDGLGALGATRQAVVEPRRHRLGHRVGARGPWRAAKLPAQLGHGLQHRRLRRAGHPAADPVPVGSEPEAGRASPACYAVPVEFGVSALVAVPVLEGRPRVLLARPESTPRAAPVGPL